MRQQETIQIPQIISNANKGMALQQLRDIWKMSDDTKLFIFLSIIYFFGPN
jgi:hypothetical protein